MTDYDSLPAPTDTAADTDRFRPKLRFALILLGVLVFGLGGAAALIPIGGAVVGSGQVGVESRVKRIAHPVGGPIAAIFVRNGDHVRKGAPLIQIDDTVSGTDAELSSLSVDQLLAQRARLETEQAGRQQIAFPASLSATGRSTGIAAIEAERRQFAIRQGEIAGARSQLAARIGQYQQQIAGYRAQIASLNKQAALIEPERRGVRELWDKDLVTLNRLNQLERTQVDMQGNIGALNAQIAEVGARITETRQALIQLGQTRRSEAGTQLAQVNAALNQQQIRRVSAGDLQDRSIVKAPYAGVVNKLAFAAIGDVVKPAETIMEVVPDTDRLIVEAAISPTDIDQVRAGQSSRLRFSAFNATSTPEIAGIVLTVAPDLTNDPEGRRSYYAVRIAVDQRALRAEPGLKLVPGMPVEVFISTGTRSMLSYITKPLRDQFARAFTDG